MWRRRLDARCGELLCVAEYECRGTVKERTGKRGGLVWRPAVCAEMVNCMKRIPTFVVSAYVHGLLNAFVLNDVSMFR